MGPEATSDIIFGLAAGKIGLDAPVNNFRLAPPTGGLLVWLTYYRPIEHSLQQATRLIAGNRRRQKQDCQYGRQEHTMSTASEAQPLDQLATHVAIRSTLLQRRVASRQHVEKISTNTLFSKTFRRFQFASILQYRREQTPKKTSANKNMKCEKEKNPEAIGAIHTNQRRNSNWRPFRLIYQPKVNSNVGGINCVLSDVVRAVVFCSLRAY